jgi:argininosuccinate lyase
MLPVVAGVIASLKIYPDKMAAQLEPSLLATDLADYLVRRGLPFRQAHHVIGQVVRLAEHHGVALTELSLVDLQSVSDIFDESVLAVFDIQASLASRAVVGGTAPAALLAQLQQAQAILREQLT